MKFSIPLALLILALGSTFGWRENRRAAAVRQDRDRLAARAAVLGISTDPADPGKTVRTTKRARANQDPAARNAAAHRTAADFIALAREVEALQKTGAPFVEDFQKRLLDLTERMSTLDAAQLKLLIDEFRAAPGLGEEMRAGLMAFTISNLASNHPQAALAMYAEVSKDMKGRNMDQQVIGNALSEWAKTDPAAAVAWLTENGSRFPEVPGDEMKKDIISSAALENPAQAFRMIGELGIRNPEDAVRNIMLMATTPEKSTAALAALRGHLATLDPQAAGSQAAAALGMLGVKVAGGGFDSATAWLETAGLSPAELGNFAQGVAGRSRTGETAEWIGWMGAHLPPDQAAPQIRKMIGDWTRNDFRAAGEWLAAEPAGPARDASVRGYAETVARYDPETAAQWAMTLPAGGEREGTLKSIFENWPRKDDESRAAAEAFAKEHGIK